MSDCLPTVNGEMTWLASAAPNGFRGISANVSWEPGNNGQGRIPHPSDSTGRAALVVAGYTAWCCDPNEPSTVGPTCVRRRRVGVGTRVAPDVRGEEVNAWRDAPLTYHSMSTPRMASRRRFRLASGPAQSFTGRCLLGSASCADIEPHLFTAFDF